MAYQNPFPATYQSMAYQPQNYMPQQMSQITSPQQSQPQQNNPMIWVQGETGAKSYLLAPNTTLPLWDSENQTIYLKSADASGMPSMKILDYTIRDSSQSQVPVAASQINEQNHVDYVTHDELRELEEKITHKFEEIMEDTGA